MSVEQCGHPKVDGGDPCGISWGLCEQCARCWVHCPHRADDLKAAQKRGGKTTARKRGASDSVTFADETPEPPETLADSLLWSAWAAHAVATGKLDTARGNAVAKLLSEFRKTLEKSESREKLEEMRQRIEELADGADGPKLEALS